MKWAALPEVSHACCELLRCGSKKAAGGSVNVSKLFYSVLICVCVKAYVTMNEMR